MTEWGQYLVGFSLAVIGSIIAVLLAWRGGFFSYPSNLSNPQRLSRQVPLGALSFVAAVIVGFLGGLCAMLLIHAFGGRILLPALLTLGVLVALLILSAALGRDVWRWLWGGPKVTGRSRWRSVGIGAIAFLIAFPLSEAVMTGISAALVGAGVSLEKQVPIDMLLVSRDNPALLTTLIVTLVLLTPAMEELFFRGFLQSALRRYFSRSTAIGVTALLFAFAHFSGQQGASNIPLLAGIFVLGCFLGFLFERERTLWAPITLHALFNAFGVGLALLSDA